jgi:uridine phosphorylase
MEGQNFPKTAGKHRFRPLYSPNQLFNSMKKAVKGKGYKKAVMIYSNAMLESFRKAYRLEEAKALKSIVNPLGIYEFGKGRLLVYIGIGAPMTAVAAEELIVAGVKEFVIMGTAGTLDTCMKIGDLILCTKALRDEGVSHHYLKSSMYVEPDMELTSRIKGIMENKGIDFHSGPTWTIDAPYMETVEEVKRYSREGITTVEMEAAALFAVAKKRKVKAAALFVVSDILNVEGWSGFVKAEYRSTYPKMARLAGLF